MLFFFSTRKADEAAKEGGPVAGAGLPHQPNLTPSALVGTYVGTRASHKNHPITDAYFPESTIASELKASICI